MKTTVSTMLVVVMLLLVLLQAGCTEFTAEDKAFVRSLVQDYLESKNMSPTNPDGTVDYIGGARFGLAMIGRSNDEEANALFGIVTSVSGVIAADKAMDEARANGDAAKMDQVIESRPGDWTYRSSRAVLALSQGDMDTYDKQVRSFTEIASEQGVPLTRQARQIIKDYETIPVPDSGEPCNRKYMNLAGAYSTLYKETGEQRYNELAAQAYATMIQLCP